MSGLAMQLDFWAYEIEVSLKNNTFSGLRSKRQRQLANIITARDKAYVKYLKASGWRIDSKGYLDSKKMGIIPAKHCRERFGPPRGGTNVFNPILPPVLPPTRMLKENQSPGSLAMRADNNNLDNIRG